MLQRYSEAMDAYSMHIWREVQVIKGRERSDDGANSQMVDALLAMEPVEYPEAALQSSRPYSV